MGDKVHDEKCIIAENEHEKLLSIIELKKECLEYVQRNFQGKAYVNTDTGREIQVSRQGLGEWKMKSKTREQVLSIRILDQMLENAAFDHHAPDEKTRPNVGSFSYFNCQCVINGLTFKAIITIKSSMPYGDKYYHHYLENIKIKPCSGTAPTPAS
jgi:hypothetical protein